MSLFTVPSQVKPIYIFSDILLSAPHHHVMKNKVTVFTPLQLPADINLKTFYLSFSEPFTVFLVLISSTYPDSGGASQVAAEGGADCVQQLTGVGIHYSFP